ncbi:MAG TPA: ribosome silencing factor [Pirellulales bacterium]|nr:ribosome silencing factor [Pirellulales bacterium]
MAISTFSQLLSDARSDRGLERALAAARTAAENRGRDITVLDLRELTSEFDFFVIATGSSRRQLHAISDEIGRVLQKQMHDHRLGSEGYADSRWILQDYGDVVVHLFEPEARQYYALDQLWAAARQVPFEAAVLEPAEAPRLRMES